MAANNRIDVEKSRKALKEALLRRMPDPGAFPTPVKGLVLHRFKSNDSLTPRFYQPVVIVVVQGKKRVRIGAEDIQYGEHSCFIVGVDMPISSCVVEATESRPYLSMSLDLDKSLIATLAAKVPPSPECHTCFSAGAVVQDIGPELLDAFLRLLELTERPDEEMVLGDLVRQEIHYRLLTSPFGRQLRTLNTLGSQNNQISRAITWLKDNYTRPLHVEKLAGRVNMAPSTFHKHFKEITTLSPLQYQKRLRLSEAQRLMLSDNLDVAQAAFSVGYESATQFNREYKRLFGEPPRKDVVKLKSAMNGTRVM